MSLSCNMWIRSLQIIFTARKRSLGQGNIFTPVCHSVHGGRAWLLGGVRGCMGGGGLYVVAAGWHAWLLGGACVVAGGHAWLWGCVCVVVGGMHGCQGGVHGWAVCMVAGGCVWLLGAMHGCGGCAWLWEACVVAGGHAWLLGGVHG